MEPNRRLRDALGCFATGVAVIATADGDAPVALTVNSFASVSLEPPLILWSIDRASDRFESFEACQRFGVSVLRAGQGSLAETYAAAATLDAADVAWRTEGAPVMDDALAWFDCEVKARWPGGDHVVILGEVHDFASSEGDALTFFRSRYGAADEG